MRRRLSVPMIVATLLLPAFFVSPTAQAWAMLDANMVDGGASFLIDASNTYAQSFTPSANAVIEAVGMYVRDIGFDSTLNVSIHADDAGPSGKALAKAYNNSAPGLLQWLFFQFPEPLAVNAWTKYWIVLRDDSPPLQGYEVQHSDADAYLKGEAARFSASGVWALLWWTDLMFVTMGTPLGTYVEFDKWAQPWADAGGTIVFILSLYNVGPDPATIWLNDTLPANTTYVWDNATDVPGYSGSWTDGSTWYYNFTGLPPGPYWFLIMVSVDGSLARGKKITNVADLTFADVAGYGDTWTRDVDVFIGVRPKTFYLHDDGTYDPMDPFDPMDTFPPMNLVMVPEDTDADGLPGLTLGQGGYSPGDPIRYQQWDLTPPLASSFRVRGDVRITLFLDDMGMGGLELVNVTLLAKAGPLETTVWTDTTPEQFWGAFEPYEWVVEDVNWNFPAGSYPALRVSLTGPPPHPNGGNDIWVAYNASNFDAQVEVLTPTYVKVEGVMTYNGTTPSFVFVEGDTITYRANVTDPLGMQDICGVELSVWDPVGAPVLTNAPMFVEFVDPSALPGWAIYRYDDVVTAGAPLGFYDYLVRGIECNGVTHDLWSSFIVIGDALLSADKTVDKSVAQAGDPLSYTIHFDNSGPRPATSVWVNDTLPLGTTFVDDNSTTLPEYAGSWFDGTTHHYNFTKVGPGKHSFVVNATVDGGLTDGTLLTNSVRLDYTNSTSEPQLGSSATADTVVYAPNVSAYKEVVESRGEAGDALHYRLYVNNTGRAAADVWIDDALDPGLTFLNASGGGSEAGGVVSWILPGVGPGNFTAFLNATVNGGAPGGTAILNDAVVDYADASGFSMGPVVTNVVSTMIDAPLLSLEKGVLEYDVEPGSVIHYKIWVNNTGNGTAGSVWVNDTLDANVAFLNASGGGALLGGDVRWVLGPLSPGASAVLNLNVTANGGLPDGTMVSNAAVLEYSDNAGYPMTPVSSNAVSTIVRAAGLGLEKAVIEGTADPGDVVHYLLWVNNTGNGTVATAWVNDTLDANVAFLTASGGGVLSGGAARWVLGPVPPGGSVLLYMNVTVNAGVPDTTPVWNAAAAEGIDTNGTALSAVQSGSVVTLVTAPHLSLVKGVMEATATPGDVLHYLLWINNSGTGTAATVWVNDTLDPNVNFLSASGGGTLAGNDVRWTLANLTPGAYVLYLNVTVVPGTADATVIGNSAGLNYTDANGSLVGSAVSGGVQTLVLAPVVVLAKVAEEGWVEPGGLIHYHIYYNNTANGTAGNVWVWEGLPPEVVLVSATPGYTQVGSTLEWQFANVAPGSYEVNVTVRALTNVAPGTVVTNQAWGDYQDLNGNWGLELSSSLPLTVRMPAFTLVKGVDLSVANPGDILRYDLWFNQTTPGVYSDLWLNDSAPPGTTLVAASPGGNVSGSDVRWSLSNLAPGSYSEWFTVRVDVGTQDGTPVSNWARLEATNPYGVPIEPRISNTVQTTVVAPSVSLQVMAAETVGEPGDEIHLLLDLNNTGNGTAGSVWVNATLPSGLLFSSASMGGTPAGDEVRWLLSDLDPGTVRLEVNATIGPAQPDGTDLQVVAYGAYTDANDNLLAANLMDTAQVAVRSPALGLGLGLNKVAADPGDIVTVTITYDNVGNGTAGTVWLNLTVPEGFTLIADSSPTLPTVGGQAVAWQLSDVAPGPHVIQATMRIGDGAPATSVFVGGLNYTDGTGTLVGSDRATSEEIEVSQPAVGGGLPDYLYLLLLFAALAALALFFVARRLRGMRVEELFLIHRNGKLIDRVSATKTPGTIDDEGFSAMLTAVQSFVSDSFKGIEDEPLQKLEFGKRKLWMENGRYLVVAVVYTGNETSDDVNRIQEALKEVEAKYRYRLKNWKGDVDELRGIGAFMATAVRAQKTPDEIPDETEDPEF